MNSAASSRQVTGALTFETVPGLHQASSDWFTGAGELTLDFKQVTHTDSAGLALMVEWLRQAQMVNCRLLFANLPAQVQTLIQINGLQDTLLNQHS